MQNYTPLNDNIIVKVTTMIMKSHQLDEKAFEAIRDPFLLKIRDFAFNILGDLEDYKCSSFL